MHSIKCQQFQAGRFNIPKTPFRIMSMFCVVVWCACISKFAQQLFAVIACDVVRCNFRPLFSTSHIAAIHNSLYIYIYILPWSFLAKSYTYVYTNFQPRALHNNYILDDTDLTNYGDTETAEYKRNTLNHVWLRDNIACCTTYTYADTIYYGDNHIQMRHDTVCTFHMQPSST